MGTVTQLQRPVRSPAGRVPVHDIDAEKSILSAILDDENAFEHGQALDRVADILRPEHFFEPHYKEMYAAALALHAVGVKATWSSVVYWLRDRELLDRVGGEAAVRDVSLAATSFLHLEEDAQRVRDLARQRAFVEAGHRVIAEGYDRHPDVQAWLDESQRKLDEISAPPAARTVVSLSDALREVFTVIEATASGSGCSGVTSGYRELDDITGGWHRGELTLLGARPGMGKSALGMAFALNAARTPPSDSGPPNGVAFFSVEMSREQLVSRAICSAARVNFNLVRTRRLHQAHWSALATAASWMSALPLWIDDDPSLTPMALRAKCRRIRAREEARGGARLGLVVVDYIQRMKSGLSQDKRRSRHEEVGHISWSLKTIAKELDIPVIALAQLGRTIHDAKDKRPRLSDLRESGDLEQDADSVLFLHRDEYYTKHQTDDELRGVAEVIVEKQRNGPLDTAYMRYFSDCALFDDDPSIRARMRRE